MIRTAFLPLVILAMFILISGCGNSSPTDPLLRGDDAGESGAISLGDDRINTPGKYNNQL